MSAPQARMRISKRHEDHWAPPKFHGTRDNLSPNLTGRYLGEPATISNPDADQGAAPLVKARLGRAPRLLPGSPTVVAFKGRAPLFKGAPKIPAGSPFPGDRGARVGGVGAVPAGADRRRQVLAKGWVGAGEVGHRGADGPGHIEPRALGVGGCPAIAAAQPDRPRQLAHQEIPLRARLGGTARIVEAFRLLQFARQLVQAGLVGGLGPSVQQLAGVPRSGRTRSSQAGHARSADGPGCAAGLPAAARSTAWNSRPGSPSSR